MWLGGGKQKRFYGEEKEDTKSANSDADEKLVAVHPVGDKTPHGHASEVHREIHAVGVVAIGVPAERHVAIENLMTQEDQDRVHSCAAHHTSALVPEVRLTHFNRTEGYR